ncbi:uncharacterized protein LOC144642841 isoform X2 [Oculina patagonica]
MGGEMSLDLGAESQDPAGTASALEPETVMGGEMSLDLGAESQDLIASGSGATYTDEDLEYTIKLKDMRIEELEKEVAKRQADFEYTIKLKDTRIEELEKEVEKLKKEAVQPRPFPFCQRVSTSPQPLTSTRNEENSFEDTLECTWDISKVK